MKLISKGKRIFILSNKQKRLCTLNLIQGFRFSDEELIKIKGREYRVWNPYRSKIAAAILKGVELPLKPGERVLYLGAAAGQTASYVSDIVSEHGIVYCIDIAPRVVRKLLLVCEQRKNMIPLLADANKPESYLSLVERCDFVFQDIAQANQTEIFLKNCRLYLRGEKAMIAVKSRSIDVTKKPSQVFKEVEKELQEDFEVIAKRRLEPFEKDHCIFLLKRK